MSTREKRLFCKHAFQIDEVDLSRYSVKDKLIALCCVNEKEKKKFNLGCVRNGVLICILNKVFFFLNRRVFLHTKKSAYCAYKYYTQYGSILFCTYSEWNFSLLLTEYILPTIF